MSYATLKSTKECLARKTIGLSSVDCAGEVCNLTCYGRYFGRSPFRAKINLSPPTPNTASSVSYLQVGRIEGSSHGGEPWDNARHNSSLSCWV